MDAAALAAALARWSHAAGIGVREGIALDGTARRGSQGRTGGVGGQLLAAEAVGAGRGRGYDGKGFRDATTRADTAPPNRPN